MKFLETNNKKKILKTIRQKKIFLVAIILVILLIILKSIDIFPFGKGYFKFLNFTNKPQISKNEDSKKISSDEKSPNKYKTLKTNIHELRIFEPKIILENGKSLKKKYNHIAILNQNKNSLEMIAIEGNTYKDNYPEGPLKIYKLSITFLSNDIQVKEKLIKKIDVNHRATDVLVTDDSRIFISYISSNIKKQLFPKIIELIENPSKKNDYVILDVFNGNPINPPAYVAQTGGKMIEYKANTILFATGDYERTDLIDDKALHTKTLLISIDGQNHKDYEIFSSGHRNPQGLLKSKNFNTILETEHGPFGGDEINILIKDKHYGWPHVTYGSTYDRNLTRWIMGNNGGVKYGRHDGYEKPIYAFIPSIGIKAIEEMPEDQTEFDFWRKNFFTCSRDGLYRLIPAGGNDSNIIRIIAHEKIDSHACRDLQITQDGIIITDRLKFILREKFRGRT